VNGEPFPRLGIERIELCLDCGELRGPWPSGLVQWCGCDRAASPQHQERWDHYDHNTVAELCRCCALELLESGSKWSIWLCRPCLEEVKALNRQAGCVFPIGRHSLMNGIGYQPGAHHNDNAVTAFVGQLHTFFQAAGATDEWCHRVVIANAAAAGLAVDRRVPLARYLSRVAAASLSPGQAFEALRQAWLLDP
jgi:hypothetical protein